MKKLIVIDTILLLTLSIMPINKNISTVTAPTKEMKNISTVTQVEAAEITSRSLEVKREEIEVIEEIEENLELTINSDLRNISNLKAEEFDKMLENTELEGLGKALEQVEKEFKINGLYLLGLACLESSYGTSSFARERNNLVGWNAVDSDPKKATYFTSKEECILFVANRLKNNYLTENGKYFNGFTANAINIKYSSDQQHAEKIVSIVNKLKNKI